MLLFNALQQRFGCQCFLLRHLVLLPDIARRPLNFLRHHFELVLLIEVDIPWAFTDYTTAVIHDGTLVLVLVVVADL